MAMFDSTLWVSFSIFPGLHPLFDSKYAPHQNVKTDTHPKQTQKNEHLAD